MPKMFTGVQNAGQTGVALNDKIVVQSRSAGAVGMTTVGVHMQLGCHLTTEASKAWEEYVTSIYNTLMRFSNFKLPFSKEQVGVYLTYCFWADISLVEAKKDIAMLNCTDYLAVSMLADYFGPGYATVEQQRYKILDYIIDYNTKSTSYTSRFAHPQFPLAHTFMYLVGNVFLDDKNDRANYIYFHAMNRSLHSEAAIVNQAMIAFDTLTDSITNPDGTHLAPTDVSNFEEIHSMILKVYGDAAIQRFPLIDQNVTIKPIYDADLLSALNNAYSTPFMYSPTWHITNEWQVMESASTLLDKASVWKGPHLVYFVTSTVTEAEQIDAALYTTYMRDGMRLYAGKHFNGENLCSDLFFSESYEISAANNVITIGGKSRSGITIAQTWYNDFSTEYIAPIMRWCSNTVLIVSPDSDSMFNLPNEVALGLRVYNQCNTGRVNIIGSTATLTGGKLTILPHSHYAVGLPIDEFAVYSDVETLLLPTVKAFFTAGVNTYRPEANVKPVESMKPVADSNNNRRSRDKRDEFKTQKSRKKGSNVDEVK